MAVNQADLILGKMGGAGATGAAPAEPKKPKTFDEWVVEMMPAIKESLPSSFTVERFSRMILTNYKGNKDLQRCTVPSVLGAALQAAQLGLMIGVLDQAYLVPFNNYQGKDENGKSVFAYEAQLMIGYKGYMELGMRTGQISKIVPGIVYPGDIFDYEYGSSEFIKHKPMGMEQDDTKPTHYYTIIHLNNGDVKFLVKSYNQIQRHAKKHTDLWKSKEGGGVYLNTKSNWYKNPDAMATKTVIREIFKTTPLTTDLMLAISADETIKKVDHDRISSNMVEEVIDITNYDAPEEKPAAQPEYREPEVVHNGKGDPGPQEF